MEIGLIACVAMVCATALIGFRMYLNMRPTIDPKAFEELRAAHEKVSRAVESVANKAGMAVRK